MFSKKRTPIVIVLMLILSLLLPGQAGAQVDPANPDRPGQLYMPYTPNLLPNVPYGTIIGQAYCAGNYTPARNVWLYFVHSQGEWTSMANYYGTFTAMAPVGVVGRFYWANQPVSGYIRVLPGRTHISVILPCVAQAYSEDGGSGITPVRKRTA